MVDNCRPANTSFIITIVKLNALEENETGTQGKVEGRNSHRCSIERKEFLTK